MTEQVLQRKDIEDYIPHRYENFLLDELTTTKDGDVVGSHFTLQINPDDDLGRQIFSKQKYPDKKTILTPILMEILALASIVSTDKLPPGYLAFYAMISDFVFKSDFYLGEKISGSVVQKSNKRGFYRFSGQLVNASGQEICSGSITAAIQDVSGGMPETESKIMAMPSFNLSIDVRDQNKIKSQDMFLCDQIVYWDQENNDFVTKYVYKKDNPLTKGHFPGNPVMMGVMQWQLVEDAVFALSTQLDAGDYTIGCDAFIVRENGAIVADVKRAEIVVTDGYAEIVKTKRVAFREIVNPEETLFVILKNVVLT